MQVKKFEAKNMKDALELVKHHLGPEAIILSAKENTRGFGLSGEGSVEVTAAVTESTLRKKKLAESKLNQQNKKQYTRSSARTQKEFINKVFENYQQEVTPPRPLTSTSYIDIFDDQGEGASSHDHLKDTASQRIQAAAKEAYKAIQEVSPPEKTTISQSVAETQDFTSQESEKDNEIMALQSQIKQLQSLIENFQKVPQNFITMHPGAEEGLPFELSFMFKKLTDSGVSTANAVELLQQAQKTLPSEQLKKKPLVEAWILRRMLDEVDVVEDPLAGRMHIFVGPAGQGKTSALVKLASQLVIQEKKKVAILTADTIKVGASEQLKIYAQILNIPFAEVKSGAAWNSLEAQLKNVDYILLDTPGSSLKSVSDLDLIRDRLPSNYGSASIHYVQSALAKDKDAFEIADRYRILGFKDVIFNRLDESSQHGIIYNFQKHFGVPLHSFGIGPQLPEDYEFATKERVIDLIFQLSNLRKERGRT